MGGLFGHLFFIICHLLALIFGIIFLVVTIPLHIIFAMARGRGKEQKKQTNLLKEQIELLKGKKKKK